MRDHGIKANKVTSCRDYTSCIRKFFFIGESSVIMEIMEKHIEVKAVVQTTSGMKSNHRAIS